MLSDRPKANVTLNQRSMNFQYIGQKEAKRREIVHFIQQRVIRRPALSPNVSSNNHSSNAIQEPGT
jgi:hypothetical protein